MSKEKIQELTEKLSHEDNDLVAMGIERKIAREKRNDRFLDHWLPIIQSKYTVKIDPLMDKYSIEPTSKGIVDYYPKSNRLLIRTSNTWKSGGLALLINLLKLK
jgi:hypothetical protein